MDMHRNLFAEDECISWKSSALCVINAHGLTNKNYQKELINFN